MLSTAAMLVGAANCAHSCGPSFGAGTSDSKSPDRPRWAHCVGMQEGASCLTLFNTVCEEKDHANVACNKAWRCIGGEERWTPVEAPKTRCAESCPATFTEVLADGCSAPNAETLVCDYAEGTCGCVKTGTSTFDWKCVKPAEGCPSPRPAIGAACSEPLVCDYGKSVFTDGARLECDGEGWQAD